MTRQSAAARVGILWRNEWDPFDADSSAVDTCRLHGVFAALAALGVAAEPVIYTDGTVDRVRRRLRDLDGILVWVNPVEQGLDRSVLDPLLREVAAAGVWVSAHPDVIARMATKRVLVDTASMSWGSDAHLYRSAGEIVHELPGRLARGARVLKQERGMGGLGVWKVELDADALRVEHARDGTVDTKPIREFAAECFASGGVVVDQPFYDQVAAGMIRVYLTHDRVVGFAHQYPRGLRPASAGEPPPGKAFHRADEPRFERLRALMDDRWVRELQALLGVQRRDLPVIWDADFFEDDGGGYALCEINASSTFAFPEHAMPGVAEAALDRIEERRGAARGAT